MEDLVGDNIQQLKPYQPGKPIEELERELGISNSIKLASNENPLGPSPRAIEAIQRAASGVAIYPDAAAYRLRAAIADKHDVAMSEVVVGNGSNELLTLAARTFAMGGTAVVSDYSFVAYRIVLQAAGVPTTIVPTRGDFAQDLQAMADACDERTQIVFLANPNNPTGVYAGREELTSFLRAVPAHVLVVVDEAYVEYAQADDYVSALQLRDVRERLMVCRTFSKAFGLAGMRVGFAVAPPSAIDFISRIREPFNTGLLGQAAALASLQDDDHLRRSMVVNEASRKILTNGCQDLGLRVIPSQTNFLLVSAPGGGRALYEAMLHQGVIVRPLAPYALHDWVRITMGTTEQTERCVAALGSVLAS